jgi:hypothetical protein
MLVFKQSFTLLKVFCSNVKSFTHLFHSFFQNFILFTFSVLQSGLFCCDAEHSGCVTSFIVMRSVVMLSVAALFEWVIGIDSEDKRVTIGFGNKPQNPIWGHRTNIHY